jgi:hypothetical protein
MTSPNRENTAMPRQPRFALGQTIITQRALRALTPEEVIAALGSHVLGDWGKLDPFQEHANELAVSHHGPVLSAYRSPTADTRFFVVTAADRSLTTVFLPGDR